MLFRTSIHSVGSLTRHVLGNVRCRSIFTILVMLAATIPSEAETTVRSLESHPKVPPTPTPSPHIAAQAVPFLPPPPPPLTVRPAIRLTPFPPAHIPKPMPVLEVSKLPYLVAIGPRRVSVLALSGPLVRRPPLPPPPPKIVRTEPNNNNSPALNPSTLTDPAQREPAEPSAFSPDAPPTLLPADKLPGQPASVKEAKSMESVLVPALRTETELKDAVIYFQTPVGPSGERVTIPIPVVPFTSPPSATRQPESRATYRKEKE